MADYLPTERLMHEFLLAAHKRTLAGNHAERPETAAIAHEVGLPPRLVEKMARHLEKIGLLDYEAQTIDLTIEGMLKAEEILAARKRAVEVQADAPPAPESAKKRASRKAT